MAIPLEPYHVQFWCGFQHNITLKLKHYIENKWKLSFYLCQVQTNFAWSYHIFCYFVKSTNCHNSYYDLFAWYVQFQMFLVAPTLHFRYMNGCLVRKIIANSCMLKLMRIIPWPLYLGSSTTVAAQVHTLVLSIETQPHACFDITHTQDSAMSIFITRV